MKTRTLGGVTVSAIRLGGTPMSIEGRPDEVRSIATKGGQLRPGDGTWYVDGRPEWTARVVGARQTGTISTPPSVLVDAERARWDGWDGHTRR